MPPVDVLDRMRSVVTLPPADFVEGVMFSAEPFVFQPSSTGYQGFQEEIATKLGVAQSDVVLIGSARLGFSLNPDHLLSPFSRKSDLDVVVASSESFDAAAFDLVKRAEVFLLRGSDEKSRLRKAREDVANGYLRPDRVPLASDLATDWFPRLAGPFVTPAARQRPVRAWLFKSLDHARICYARHIAKLQADVAKILYARGDL